jgi:uncharacterized protein (DUF2235 family)
MSDHRIKKLTVFFDGTWNRADQKSEGGLPCPTNVMKLFEATLPDDKHNNPQIMHYVRGVGTRRLERITGGGFGYGISDNIKEGYRFLVSNYEPGDEIYVFGFSRGAYTARSLAGLIRNVGILKREKLYMVNDAFNMYSDRSDAAHPEGQHAAEFRQQNTWGNETIRFLGVFDTVGALGAPFGFILSWIVNKLFKCSFHDTKLSSIIKSAYHAVAIDERRLPFQPTLMQSSKSHDPSNFGQRWFPGVHSNIGGGYSWTGLSDCSLDWMAQKAIDHGLNLDLKRISIPPFHKDIMEPIENSQTPIYRIATVLLVKLPACIGLVPKRYKQAVPHITWNGDFIRPIPEKGEVKPFICDPPNQNANQYKGALHRCVIEKIIRGGNKYKPLNVC